MNPEDREGERGDMTGYTPTPENLCLQEVYGTGFTTNLALYLMVESGTTRYGKGGDMTSWSCPHTTAALQSGRSGDAS